MDATGCRTSWSGRTLVQQDQLISPTTPTDTIDTSLSQLEWYPSSTGPDSPTQNFDPVQISHALGLVSQWIHQSSVPAPPTKGWGRGTFPLSDAPSPPLNEENGKAAKEELRISKASKFKTWVKASNRGLIFRVRKTLDGTNDEVTDLHFQPELYPQVSHDAGDYNHALASDHPHLVEMDADQQQIQEMPVVTGETQAQELPSAPYDDPPIYRIVDDEKTWTSIELPETSLNTRSEDSEQLIRAPSKYNGVTRLKTTSHLLHKIKEERQKLYAPLVDELSSLDTPVHDDVTLYRSKYSFRRGDDGVANNSSVRGHVGCTDTMAYTDAKTSPATATERPRGKHERSAEIESAWENLLIKQTYILGEDFPLVAKARHDFIASKRNNHQHPGLIASLGESCSLASRHLGLINPIVSDFSQSIQRLEELLNGPGMDLSEWSRRQPLPSLPGHVKAASAPVSPIDGRSDGGEIAAPSLQPELDREQAPDVSADEAARKILAIRKQQSLPSMRRIPCAPSSDVPLRDHTKDSRSIREDEKHSVPSQSLRNDIAPGTGERPSSYAEEATPTKTIAEVTGFSRPDQDQNQGHLVSELRHRTEHQRYVERSFPRQRQSHISEPPRVTLVTLMINGMLELVREGATFLQRVAGTDPVRPGLVRVNWQCSCGAQLHDDFEELRPGAADELEAQLNGFRVHNNNNSNNNNDNNSNNNAPSPSSSAGSNVNSVFSSPANSAPSSATTRSTSNSAANSPTGFKPMQTLPAPGTFSITVPERNPPYLLTCLNEGRFTPKLTHLDMGPDRISNDKDLALALRTHYFGVNGQWYQPLRLRGLTSIDFVRFQTHKNRFADIRKRPDMPGPDNRDYAFIPDLVPPVGSNYLIHLLNHPQDYEDECIAYERIPKRINRLTPGECGWGVELVETLLPERVWGLVLLIFGLGSLVFGTVWAAKKHDIQGAFGVSAWICGLVVLLVGWLQACMG